METKKCSKCGRIIKYPDYDCPMCDTHKHKKMTYSDYEGSPDWVQYK